MSWASARRRVAWATVAVVVAAGAAAVVAITQRPQPPQPRPATLASTPTPATRSGSPTPAAQGAPHVMVIVEENRGYDATLGSCSNDAYLCSLASSYASLTSWYAIAHPSAPNYLAIESGATQGVTSDCAPDGGGCGPFSAPDLGSELSGAGIPWIAYMESMPSACDRIGGSGDYAEKHDPFMYFTANRGSGCATHIRPYPGRTALAAALNSSTPPDFVWITPNLQNDMHDGSVARGDAWLRTNLPVVLASTWFADRGTVIITMDENDAASAGSCCGDARGGRVPMIVLSANARGRGSVPMQGDHFSTLRTVDEVFGLRPLGGSASATGDLRALFG